MGATTLAEMGQAQDYNINVDHGKNFGTSWRLMAGFQPDILEGNHPQNCILCGF